MSRTLTLIPTGWESVRATANRGGVASALNQVERVLARPDVPPALAADGHRLAGELALDLGRYATARRHLRAATGLDPAHAGAWFLTGRAWEEDPNGCDRRAAIAYKKATALDATDPTYRVYFGRAAARCGKLKLGARAMLAAAGPAVCERVVRVAVEGLIELGQIRDALALVAKARFLAPGSRELAGLWERLRFEAARLNQRKQRHEKARYAQDAHFARDGDRVNTLPFVRLAGGGTGEVVRRDAASFPRPHVARLRARRADY